jgi:hypothetical protein
MSKADRGEVDNFSNNFQNTFATNGGVFLDYNNVITPGGGQLGPAGKAISLNTEAALAPQLTKIMNVSNEVTNAPEMMTPLPQGNSEYTPGLPSCCPSTATEEIRNNGLYGVVGDLRCRIANRKTIADKGFVEPLNARTEWARYASYDVPHKRDQYMIQKPNTVNQQTYMFK